MSANRAVILALTAATALAGQPLLGQASRRGGGGHSQGGMRPGGGGRPAGAHATPRGGAPARPGYGPRGSVATARHPRAGTGAYSYGPRYGGHYRPYYGRSYGGYYRPYWYGSYSWGWPYYSSPWWPYGYDSPSVYVSYYSSPAEPPAVRPEAGAYVAPPRLDSSRDTGRIRLEVRPEDASVYVDDEFWGNARETKFLTLRSGRHSIEIVRPGFGVVRREVDVVRAETIDVLVELERP